MRRAIERLLPTATAGTLLLAVLTTPGTAPLPAHHRVVGTETAPTLAVKPRVTFHGDGPRSVDGERRIHVTVPAGLELELGVRFDPAAEGLRTTTVTSTRDGDVVSVAMPEGVTGQGVFRFVPTHSTRWPSWALAPFEVVASADPHDGYPRTAVTIAGEGIVKTTAWPAVAGTATTVPLPALPALSEVTDPTVVRAAFLVQASRVDRFTPESETAVPISVEGDELTYTLAAGFPAGAYPADRVDPKLRLLYSGARGGLGHVFVQGPLDVTTHPVDRPGLARPDGDRLLFLLPQAATGTPALRTVAFGRPGDVPLLGDWDGDGRPSLGVYRPSTSTFLLVAGATGRTVAVRLGRPGDIPLAGRFAASSKQETVAVYRPSTSTFHLASTNETGSPLKAVRFGRAGDVPLLGHWTGARDGIDVVGVYRPSARAFLVGSANTTGGGRITTRPFGSPGDLPVTGDFDGDGLDDPGVRRPGTNTFYLGSGMGRVDPRTTLRAGRPSDRFFSWTP